MSELIIVKNKYNDDSAVEDVIRYICASPYAVSYKFISVIADDYIQCIDAFNQVQVKADKNNGKRISHFIIGFEDQQYERQEIEKIACCVAMYFGVIKKHQTVYSIHAGSHKNRNNWHIHFVLNSINFMTGNRFSETNKDFYDMLYYLKTEYGIDIYWQIVFK